MTQGRFASKFQKIYVMNIFKYQGYLKYSMKFNTVLL